MVNEIKCEIKLMFQLEDETVLHTANLDGYLTDFAVIPRQGEIIHVPHHLTTLVGRIRSWYVEEVQHDLEIDRQTIVLFLRSVRSVIIERESMFKRPRLRR